ncbi:MAG: EAL domain-containing protein, partial [Leptolyngbyaceae cyanobacterium bins.59]|nr:EAL domain-containing protein [Leptolyngbyaceae cyanobacterium bins.59]
MANSKGTSLFSILIVDDVPANLRLLSEILTQQGYHVLKASGGRMALTAAQTALPDLILLDIMMPEMDGYQVCQYLKTNASTSHIPVIFISALGDPFDKVKAFQCGAVDYVTKPFEIEEFMARVHNQLALQDANQTIRQLNLELEERVQTRTRELETSNAQLLRLALYDPLTGLPNRTLLAQQLEQRFHNAQVRPSAQFAVLFLDCDRFKIINDSLGYDVGNELLIAVAQRLQGLLTPEDTLAHLGGDEFAILFTQLASANQVNELADRILQSFHHPFQLKRHQVFINVTIGIVLSHPRYEKPEHLLRDADTAMYRAKAAGKAQYQVFDIAMHDAALRTLELETDLRRAITQQEFVLHYQPIVSLNTGKLVGFEALIRWCDPNKGFRPPANFVPLAEETGLILAIGEWVLREACRQTYEWQQHLNHKSLLISVNLSARQFMQPNLLQQIDGILQETHLAPECLKLEITEGVIMENTARGDAILHQLKQRQIQLSIDDFGTGYSSLSYLHRLPVDNLKIDRSFVQGIDRDGEKLELVRAIVNLAWNLGMEVIAEGVETPKQLAQLRSLKCDFA